MADFQSFLFKSMHSIGLQEDNCSLEESQESDGAKKSATTISSKTNDLNKSLSLASSSLSSKSSSSSSSSKDKQFPRPVCKPPFASKSNKNDSFCNISILTTETCVSSMTKESCEEENNEEKLTIVEVDTQDLPPPPTPFKHEEIILEHEETIIKDEKYDNNEMVESFAIIPICETIKEEDVVEEREDEFKGPKPVAKHAQVASPPSRDTSHDCDREAKSPKPVFGSISRRILKKLSSGDFSPIRSIFQKKNSISKHSSSNNLSKSHPPDSSTLQVGDEGDKEAMEPYLNKFEAEVLRKTKTEILHDYNKQAISESLKVDEKEVNKNQALLSPSQKALDELKRLSENNIPWDELEKYSAISLLNRVRLNSDKQYNSLPIIYNTIGERIDSIQIRKWLKTLEDAGRNVTKEPTKCLSAPSPPKEMPKVPEKPVAVIKKKKKAKTEDRSDEHSAQLYVNRSTKPNFELKSKPVARSPSPIEDTIEFSISASELEDEHEDLLSPTPSSPPLSKIVKSKLNNEKIDHLYNEINENDMKNRTTRRQQRKRLEDFERDDEMFNRSREVPYNKHSATTMKAKSHPVFNAKKHTSAAEAAKNFLKKPIVSLAKLKSPERKILYNEWRTIIKRMDSDPKFNLETLVRTRGRFTDHDAISYRDNLKSARSVPNFSDLQLNSSSISDESMEKFQLPNKSFTQTNSCTMPNRSVYHDKQSAKKVPDDTLPAYNEEKPVLHPIKPKVKLTLKKNEIETIKDEIKKKHKNISTHDLNKLVLQTLRTKAIAIAKEKEENRKRIEEDVEEDEIREKEPIKPLETIRKPQKTRRREVDVSIEAKPPQRHKKIPHQNEHSEVTTTIHEEDETTEETSIMSKYKNFAQKCRQDGAKAFCDEFGKLKNKFFHAKEEPQHQYQSSHSRHQYERDESATSRRQRSNSNAPKSISKRQSQSPFRPAPPKRPPPPRPSSNNRPHSKPRSHDHSVPRRVPKSDLSKIPKSSKPPPHLPPPPPRTHHQHHKEPLRSGQSYELDEYDVYSSNRHQKRMQSPKVSSEHRQQHRSHSRNHVKERNRSPSLLKQQQQQQTQQRVRQRDRT